MDKDTIKRQVCQAIDEYGERAINLARDVEREPELGFKEFKTSQKIQDFLTSLGLAPQTHLARTGVKATLSCGTPGPTAAILGELDGIICSNSPKADPETGATHTCGHHLQLGALIAAAAGFAASGVSEHLAGRITFFAVPAEEFIEIGERNDMRSRGEIGFLGGKQELVRLGAFDDIDMAMMVHAGTDMPESSVGIGETGNGFIAKTIQYIGKATHAAAAPHEGVNALNAAILGINGIHAMRETFIDDDHVRVHFIITKGGDTVNSIPADVRMEAYVRGKTLDSINGTHAKFDRAFRAGGDAVGASTEIHTIPGYLPLACNPEMNDLFGTNAEALLSSSHVHRVGHFNASTDMGDICHLMPAIHPYTGGVQGALHSKEFTVLDYEAAVLVPAKAMAMTVIDLLADGAQKGGELLHRYVPLMTKKRYLEILEGYFS
ncbi:MAG: amidohydrolase [Dethiosulfovibrio peptidovorans]|nr:MAG: amidohydrolase [Dethiosulfovibrio peptidovorans]